MDRDESAPPVDEAILRLKDQKEIEYAEMCKRWGPVVFVAPFAPLCLAVINLFICTLVVNIASSDCVQPINSAYSQSMRKRTDHFWAVYLVGQIVMSYILLIAYAFAVIGPVRLTRFEPAKWFAVIFSLFAIVWYGIWHYLSCLFDHKVQESGGHGIHGWLRSMRTLQWHCCPSPLISR